MKTVYEDIMDDRNSHPVKIHLPSKLIEELNIYCDKTQKSKSEVIRDYLRQGLEMNPVWVNRLYFFKKRNIENIEKIKTFLKSPSLNTPIKIACSSKNDPSQAQLCIGYLNKVDEDNLTLFIPSHLDYYLSDFLTNAHHQLSDIFTSKGHLCIPESQEVINIFNYNELRLTYTIPMDYIWDVIS